MPTKTYASVAYVGTKHKALEAAFREAASELNEAEKKVAESAKAAEEKVGAIMADARKQQAAKLKEAEEQAKVITDNSVEVCKVKEEALKEHEAKVADRETKVADREGKWETIGHSIEQFKTRVKLNVGGRKFETTRSTLEQQVPDGMLAIMFSGRHAVDSDDKGFVFIDRDGTHFGTILNFMRSGKAAWSESASQNAELREELNYYMLLEAFEAAVASKLDLSIQCYGQRKEVVGSKHILLAHTDGQTTVCGFDTSADLQYAWINTPGIRRISVKVETDSIIECAGVRFVEVAHAGPNPKVDDLMRKELTNLKKRASVWFVVGGRR